MKPYYEDTAAGITLYHGDAREIIPTLGMGVFDALITDPPYPKVKNGTGVKSMGGKLSRHSPLVNSGKLFKHNELPFKDWMPLAFAAVKPGTHAYVFSDAFNSPKILNEMIAAGFQLAALRSMIKENFIPSPYGGMDCEPIWMFRKGSCRFLNDCGVRQSIHVKMDRMTFHPTQKPIHALTRLVMDSTNPGDIVLDPFSGSGTTARACKDLARHCVTIELDESFCEFTAKRMQQNVLDFQEAV